ncbi:MAG: hypothetical protein DRJ18_00355 [Candidatus Methanomethylicota archaeon]|nr:MAG: hypothetical protein DRJ18_00355 [Candidatus Verstraetearchaeota archaeon]
MVTDARGSVFIWMLLLFFGMLGVLLLEPRVGAFYMTGTLGAFAMVGIYRGRFEPEYLGIDITEDTWKGTVLGIIVGFLMAGLAMGGMFIAKPSSLWILAESWRGGTLPLPVVLFLVFEIAFAEEIIFRGLGYINLKETASGVYGSVFAGVLAAVSSSAAFAIFHYPAYGDWKLTIFPFVAGLLFVGLYEITNTLWSAIVAHYVYDAAILYTKYFGSPYKGLLTTMLISLIIAVSMYIAYPRFRSYPSVV